MEKMNHQQQEEFNLDAYRDAWRQEGEQLAQKPWLTDEELNKVIDQAEFTAAIRRKRLIRVAVAACLVIGVGISAYHLLQPESGISRGEVAQNKPIVSNPLAQDDTIVEEAPQVDLAQVKTEVVEQVAPKSAAHTANKATRKAVKSVKAVERTEVMCNSSCDSSAVLGQIRAFLLDREV